MSPTARATFSAADVGQTLVFTITKDGAPANLTGATVALLVNGNARSPFACTVTNATGGVAQYVVLAGDFAVAGQFSAQIQVTFSPTSILNSPTFLLQVDAQYG